jgi:tRNA A37 threonylcarbamoyladenosine dehydratase
VDKPKNDFALDAAGVKGLAQQRRSHRLGGDTMTTDTARQQRAHETEIAIIGCGPVGAMLANLLGLQGIATLVLGARGGDL